MTFSIEEQLKKLDGQIQAKHLLNHPFYLAWSKGELSNECLKEYALEYYHHVKAFPSYLSALHSRTEDAASRRHLLNNLIDEEAGTPNHPELWSSFALSLGASQEEIDRHRPNEQIQELIHAFRQICQNGNVAQGLAALYAYESQIPEICRSKIKGLKEHYGMRDPEQWKYFTVHIGADEEHSRVERDLLRKHLTETSGAHQAAEKILEKLWDFLSGLCHRYEIACA